MTPGFTLYHFETCPYCRRVRRAMRDLDVAFELRDIHREPAAKEALVEATGRATVPVLAVEEDGQTRWMPESSDIVRFLYDRFGDGRAPPLSVRLNPQMVIITLAVLVFALLVAFS